MCEGPKVNGGAKHIQRLKEFVAVGVVHPSTMVPSVQRPRAHLFQEPVAIAKLLMFGPRTHWEPFLAGG